MDKDNIEILMNTKTEKTKQTQIIYTKYISHFEIGLSRTNIKKAFGYVHGENVFIGCFITETHVSTGTGDDSRQSEIKQTRLDLENSSSRLFNVVEMHKLHFKITSCN